ncbi:MAG: dipeptide epimerase, partial [Lachnospiraceae bacterium]|nr:dipeptide epimerase [Lachnospiraceae bacterium]
KKPLYKVLGGNKQQVETDITISVNEIPEMVADSKRGVADGFKILKIKVGKEGLKDVDRILAIRDAVGPEVILRIDANQGWTPKEAVKIITALEDKGVEMDLVEQPVKGHDIDGMEYVTSHVNTKILADESLFSPEDAVTLIKRHAADLLNIKLMKCGGIYQALKICSIAEIYGVECMIGCMLESKISVSAAAHLAAGKGIITRADLDGPALCKIDPYTGGPAFNGALITMPKECGIGITNIEEALWKELQKEES